MMLEIISGTKGTRRGRPPKVTDKTKARILELRAEGNSFFKIAVALNLSEGTVRAFCTDPNRKTLNGYFQ